jgi:hypothetical protein
MNKFDQTILEYAGNLPAINPEDAAKKLQAALKGVPPTISKTIAGVGGAIQNATQPDPKIADLLTRFNDPNSKFTSDEAITLGNFFNQRGFEFKPAVQQSTEQDKEETESNNTESGNNQKQSSSSYGVQEREIQGV